MPARINPLPTKWVQRTGSRRSKKEVGKNERNGGLTGTASIGESGCLKTRSKGTGRPCMAPCFRLHMTDDKDCRTESPYGTRTPMQIVGSTEVVAKDALPRYLCKSG